jgi:general secretion pathway protein F
LSLPAFRYKAIDTAGAAVEGVMEAADEATVIQRLHDIGHVPVRAEHVASVAARSWLSRDLFTRDRLSQRHLAIVTRELSTLLHAGLPLDRALSILIELAESAAVADVMERVRDRVRGGATFADALAADERNFPSYYLSMVRAGELGGAMEVVLARLADYIARSQAMSQQIRTALVYPVFLLLMAGVAVVILFTVVVPEFKPLFEDAGQELPLATRVFIAIGDLVQKYWWAILIAVALAVLGFRSFLATPAGRQGWDRLVLGLPLVGGIIAKVEASRLGRTVGTLLQNGVPVLSALAIVRETVGNTIIAGTLEEAADGVKRGQGLAAPLAATERFPPLFIHLVRVGEESGQLVDMLIRAAEIFDSETQRAIERMLALLVPILTIAMGLLIAGIISSILVALLSINKLVV